MKVLRKIVQIDEEKCDGCGLCVPACAEGAIQIIDGKARLIAEKYCDGLGACLGECPNDAIKIVEREAEDFDEKAVEEHLKSLEKKQEKMACGCPSSNIQIFDEVPSKGQLEEFKSALSHWPVQIKLIPPHAPYLKDAHILVCADCVPVAYPNLHKDLLPGKVIMIGCPKFDNKEEYVEKFKQIFLKNDIKSVTIATIKVPCCSALPMIVKKGMELAGKDIEIKEIIVDPKGFITNQ